MDRNSILRFVFLSGAILLFFVYVMPLLTGKRNAPSTASLALYTNAPGFEPDAVDRDSTRPPAEGEICRIKGVRFDAELSSRGAALTHLMLRDAQYAGATGFDLSTTPDHERWRSLRTTFREGGADSQFAFDRFPWKLEQLGETGCKFTYEDAQVLAVKTVKAGSRPFELDVETTITNRASEPKKHALSISTHAYRRNEDVKGGLGRVSPFVTELSCAKGTEVTRKGKDDFKEGAATVGETDRYAAVSNYYFAQAVVLQPGSRASCQVVAHDWPPGVTNEKEMGAIYSAKLTYAPMELAPQGTATYKQTAFFGPKERGVLAHAAGGESKLGDLINLGFFSSVAKVLVGFLNWVHDHVTFGSWGVAIIVMTILLRIILFPLTWKSIKSTLGMRRLKPELDALNAKFKDDPQAKQMAMMELWRKHGINPLGGCLPQLVQMPIWFAMYTTLQTAVEMYHTKFLWFTDLSEPDRFFVLPLVLGACMFIQQKLVPATGMDPIQQKMMTYFLPGLFTVMMLFLPAALGVYMLTNSILQIIQTLVMEHFAPTSGGGTPAALADGKDSSGPSAAFGKGKARV